MRGDRDRHIGGDRKRERERKRARERKREREREKKVACCEIYFLNK